MTTIGDIQSRLAQLERRIVTLERADAITILEAIRLLERWICFLAVDRVRAKFIRGCWSFDRIVSTDNANLINALHAQLARLGLNCEHLADIQYLKDSCDRFLRSPLRVSIVGEEVLIQRDYDEREQSDDDKQEHQLLSKLITALLRVVPLDGDDSWILVDPVEKSFFRRALILDGPPFTRSAS